MTRPLHPLPETVEAVGELGPGPDDDLLTELGRLVAHATEVVPSLAGVSLARSRDGVTFTLVSSSERAAALDAVQYVDGGPCVAGGHDAAVHALRHDDPLDEERWRLFAAATAAHGVCSTLTLPVVDGGEVVGTVNLYAAQPHAFDDRIASLADVFGAWAEGAVTNADLSFSTRDAAREAPQRLRDRTTFEVATGIVAAQLDVDVEAAEAHLLDAASQAGVEPVELALEVIRVRWGR